jgi:exosortase
MSNRARTALAAALMTAAFLALYLPVLVRLGRDWVDDPNYSHGFFILPLALYFIWERRRHLTEARADGSFVGLAAIAAGIGLLLAGLLGAELFVSRVSMLVVMAGMVLYVWGWKHLRMLLFPLAFLLLMIPIPSIIFNSIAFPLQLVASRFGEVVLNACHIPVLREGNVIILPNVTLEVAEACSGIRSLVSLLTLGIVYGYFIDRRASFRVWLAALTIPVAILTNGIRVAVTGIAARYYGAQAAEGFLHESAGIIIFGVAFVALFALARLIKWASPGRQFAGAETVLQEAGAR